MSLFSSGTRAVVGYDVTGANIAHAPQGAPLASYVTGTGPVPAPPSFWAANPGAVRIDQTPAGTGWDALADVDDYERGAVTLAELAPRAQARMDAFARAARPGQREPAVYASASSITPVVNALIGGGVTSGVGLWVANWSIGEATALADVLNASGPFPIVAVQYASGQFYDTNVFSEAWLGRVSGTGPRAHYAQAGQTLYDLAGARNMDVLAWLRLQEQLHPDDARNLAGRATARPGSRWWTE